MLSSNQSQDFSVQKNKYLVFTLGAAVAAPLQGHIRFRSTLLLFFFFFGLIDIYSVIM